MAAAGSPKRKAGDKTLTPSKYVRTPSVEVLVGPNRTEFSLPSGLRIRESSIFAAKAKSCWSETTTDIELVDVSEAGFEVVVDWMIEKKLPVSLDELRVLETGLNSGELTDHAYKAADFLVMPLLQNQLFHNLIENIAENRGWVFFRLPELCSLGLCQGPYYQLVIDSPFVV